MFEDKLHLFIRRGVCERKAVFYGASRRVHARWPTAGKEGLGTTQDRCSTAETRFGLYQWNVMLFRLCIQ